MCTRQWHSCTSKRAEMRAGENKYERKREGLAGTPADSGVGEGCTVCFLILPQPLRDFFQYFSFPHLPTPLFTLVPSPTSPLSPLDLSLSVSPVQTSHGRCCCDNVQKQNRCFVSAGASGRRRGCYFHHLYTNASRHLQPSHHIRLHCCADIIY